MAELMLAGVSKYLFLIFCLFRERCWDNNLGVSLPPCYLLPRNVGVTFLIGIVGKNGPLSPFLPWELLHTRSMQYGLPLQAKHPRVGPSMGRALQLSALSVMRWHLCVQYSDYVFCAILPYCLRALSVISWPV